MTVDLFRPFMAPDAGARVAEVLSPDSNGRIYVGEGARVKRFEHELGQLIDSPLVPLAFSSCTAALEMALHIAHPGMAEVITTPITCTATNAAIARSDGEIVWADVDPVTGLIDPIDVLCKRTKHTSAIMAVDWGGRLCDYAALKAFGQPVIQDAAHSLLAGACGDYVAYSFGPIKHLSCGGHGGALIPPSGEYDRAKRLRWYGFDRDDSRDFRCAQDITDIGWKAHLTDVDAAIGLANIPYARWVVHRHRANAWYYHQALAGVPGLTLAPYDPGSSYWLFDVLTEGGTLESMRAARDSLAGYLAARGIETSRVHRRNDTLPALRRFAVNDGADLPGVAAFDARHLAIPVGWWVTETEREQVVSAIKEWATAKVLA